MASETTAKKPTGKRRGRVEIREDECKGCGLCIDACPQRVLEPSGRLNRMGYRSTCYQGAGCIACGICFYACPEPGAITVFELEEGE